MFSHVKEHWLKQLVYRKLVLVATSTNPDYNLWKRCPCVTRTFEFQRLIIVRKWVFIPVNFPAFSCIYSWALSWYIYVLLKKRQNEGMQKGYRNTEQKYSSPTKLSLWNKFNNTLSLFSKKIMHVFIGWCVKIG